MHASEFPSCCALRVIGGASVIGATDAWCKREAGKLNELEIDNPDEFDQDYSTAGVLTVSDQDPEQYKRAEVFLEKHGWKLLGVFPGAHPDWVGGKYSLYLWGSKEFKRPKG